MTILLSAVLYVEGCESGSVFAGYLPPDPTVLLFFTVLYVEGRESGSVFAGYLPPDPTIFLYSVVCGGV